MENNIFMMFLIAVSGLGYIFTTEIPKLKKKGKNPLYAPNIWIVIMAIIIAWIISL